MSADARADGASVVVKLSTTRTACSGAAASYVMRTLAHQAGCLAPGIQDVMFHKLNVDRFGRNLDGVELWFRSYRDSLQSLGYRLAYRRVAFRTAAIVNWVLGGDGYRGAVLRTDVRRLHPATHEANVGAHAVAILGGPKRKHATLVDPWPGGSPQPGPIPDELHLAHQRYNFRALVIYWQGYS